MFPNVYWPLYHDQAFMSTLYRTLN